MLLCSALLQIYTLPYHKIWLSPASFIPHFRAIYHTLIAIMLCRIILQLQEEALMESWDAYIYFACWCLPLLFTLWNSWECLCHLAPEGTLSTLCPFPFLFSKTIYFIIPPSCKICFSLLHYFHQHIKIC
jgi:hypothetical protein